MSGARSASCTQKSIRFPYLDDKHFFAGAFLLPDFPSFVCLPFLHPNSLQTIEGEQP